MISRLPRILLLLSSLALPVAAQAPDASTFLIDDVVVEGVKSATGRNIVTSESLLVIGRPSTEEEVRLALYRVRRLPFVLHADFALREGKEPGSRTVVFAIEPNTAYFLQADVGGAHFADAEDDATDWGAAVEVGGRLFVGSRGLFDGSVVGFDGVGASSVQAGYRQYGLFGRGAKLDLSARTNIDRDDSVSYDTSAILDVPLFGAHVLRSNVAWSQSDTDGSGFTQSSKSQEAGVAWVFDTTDDPQFATRGSFALGGIRYGKAENRFAASDFSGQDKVSSFGATLQGRRYRAVNDRNTLFGDFSAGWSRFALKGIDGDRKDSSGVAGLGHAFDILGSGSARQGLDLRWETSLSVTYNRSESPFGTSRLTDANLTTGLKFRAPWGAARLTFTYLDNLDHDFRFTGGQL